jgi:hypothetical protein
LVFAEVKIHRTVTILKYDHHSIESTQRFAHGIDEKMSWSPLILAGIGGNARCSQGLISPRKGKGPKPLSKVIIGAGSDYRWCQWCQ